MTAYTQSAQNWTYVAPNKFHLQTGLRPGLEFSTPNTQTLIETVVDI